LPAALLARWPLDRADQDTTPDASGNSRDGQVAGADWTADGSGGRALSLSGNGYVSGAGLGQPGAISVSLWIRPTALPNRWNPLLFSDGNHRGAFHFSLLPSGIPNVAIRSSSGSWTHRRAATALPVGQWRHLVVTCDARHGGSICFYIDGQKDSQQTLGISVPLDLSSFRIGSWSSWENKPNAGFQGLLDEVSIYRGTLTDQEIAGLFATGRTAPTLLGSR
jgi:hypothetical protein